MFRAYDKLTGEIHWGEEAFEAGTTGAPVSYLAAGNSLLWSLLAIASTNPNWSPLRCLTSAAAIDPPFIHGDRNDAQVQPRDNYQ